MSPPDDHKKRVPACETGHPDESTNTLARNVNFDQSAHDASVDEAVGYSEPGELAEFMFTADVRTWQVKRAALLALLHIETRSFQEVADSLGVSKAAISKEYIALVDRLGWKSLFKRLESRKRYAMAARRRHAAKAARRAAKKTETMGKDLP
jgi:hypothetical protein